MHIVPFAAKMRKLQNCIRIIKGWKKIPIWFLFARFAALSLSIRLLDPLIQVKADLNAEFRFKPFFCTCIKLGKEKIYRLLYLLLMGVYLPAHYTTCVVVD